MSEVKQTDENNVVRKKPIKRPKIIVFLGYSCSGKDKCLQILNEYSRYPIVVSTTSRPIRDGEVNGVNYHFVSKKKFQQMIVENQLLEYREYHTLVNNKPDVWYYGVNKNELGKGYRLAVLDSRGLEKIKEFYGEENVLSIWVDCPTNLRKQRNINRGDYDEVEFQRRDKADKKSFKKYKKQCDCVLYNDHFSESTLRQDIMRLYELSDFIFAGKIMNPKCKQLIIKRKKK